MAKSPDAFRTISEVAEWLDTPAHVLRFWESKFTQVRPVKRAGGRRYYRPDDMALLGGIKVLLHDEGLTIKGAQKLLREKGVRHVMGLAEPIGGTDTAEAIEIEAPRPVLIDRPSAEADLAAAATEPTAEPAPAPEPAPETAPDTTEVDTPQEAPFTEAEPAEEPARILSFPQAAPKDTPETAPETAPEAGPVEAEDAAPEPAEAAKAPPAPLLGPLLAARSDALEARAAELAPLVARLSALSQRLSPR